VLPQTYKERELTSSNLMVKYDFHLTHIQRIQKGDRLSVATPLPTAKVFEIPNEKLATGLCKADVPEARSKSSKK